MAMLSGAGKIEDETVCIILFILAKQPIVEFRKCLSLETSVVPSVSFIFLLGSVISFCLGLSFALLQFYVGSPIPVSVSLQEYDGDSSYVTLSYPWFVSKGLCPDQQRDQSELQRGQSAA